MRYLKIIGIFIGFFFTITASALTLTSPDFQNAQQIPASYTCDGNNQPPDLSWADVPLNTQSFVLVVEDPDAPRGIWMHWVVFDIPAATRRWTAQMPTPNEAVEGNNSWDQVGYRGPCPPSGEHRYFFRLYALDIRLNLPVGTDAAQLNEAMKGHVLAGAVLMGKYSRR